MKYGLYNNQNSTIAEKLIDEAILNFIVTLKSIDNTYRKTGMTDTASREKIGLMVADMIFNEL